jgi:uroporphyrinogen III methyltransferase/synthase
LAEQLTELGAEVVEAPTIELTPPENWSEIDSAMLAIESTRNANAEARAMYDWLLFTSPNGVRATRQRLRALKRDARLFSGLKVAAVGRATAEAIEQELCLNVDVCPEAGSAEALADALAATGEIGGRRFLLLRADIARPTLTQRLEQAGASAVMDLAIYRTVPVTQLNADVIERLERGDITWLTFTSSSTARNLMALTPEKLRGALKQIKTASIGEQTTGTLAELGLQTTVQAETASIEALVEAIVAHVHEHRHQPALASR